MEVTLIIARVIPLCTDVYNYTNIARAIAI